MGLIEVKHTGLEPTICVNDGKLFFFINLQVHKLFMDSRELENSLQDHHLQ